MQVQARTFIIIMTWIGLASQKKIELQEEVKIFTDLNKFGFVLHGVVKGFRSRRRK